MRTVHTCLGSTNKPLNIFCTLGTQDYVHRVGRTGRAGLTGQAITFFTGRDASTLASKLEHLSSLSHDKLTQMLSLVIVTDHSHELVKILAEAKQPIPPQVCYCAAVSVIRCPQLPLMHTMIAFVLGRNS